MFLGIRHRKLQLEALQHLVQLLPPSNRDTLYTLLNFLSLVAQHAEDTEDDSGKINNILHKYEYVNFNLL